MRVAMLASLVACASAPPVAQRAECPARGPRTASESPMPAHADAQRGAQLFAHGCASCHASAVEQRAPTAPANAPRLDCGEWLAETSDAALYEAINRGPGGYGHGPLPPLGEQLTPSQIADLVAYLRQLTRAGSEPTTRR
jgi:mono/diheme cytochrome c family protein